MFSDENFDELTQKFDILAFDGKIGELEKVIEELLFFKNGLDAEFDDIYEQIHGHPPLEE